MATAVFAAGIALAVVGFGLAATARASSVTGGIEVPALHDSALRQADPVHPGLRGCSAGGFQVCLHPAFKGYLSQAVNAFGPVIAELSGLPGTPVRAVEVSGQALPPIVQQADADGVVTGNPPVYEFSMDGAIAQVPDAAQFRDGFQQDIVHAVIVGPVGQLDRRAATSEWNAGTPAQQAVVDGLLKAVGSQPYPACSPNALQCASAAAGHGRRRQVRRAARRHPARLAGRQPRRAEGRPHHPGTDPVSRNRRGFLRPGPAEPGSGPMTVTDIRKPPPAAAPAGRHVPPAARLAWLHLRSRRVPSALVALLACGVALWASLHYHWWLGTGNAADELPMILQGCAAGIIAVTTHSPFGEPERATGRRLPFLRPAWCSRCAGPPSGSSPSARRPRTTRRPASTWPAASSRWRATSSA